jgi:hypothetical protein
MMIRMTSQSFFVSERSSGREDEKNASAFFAVGFSFLNKFGRE